MNFRILEIYSINSGNFSIGNFNGVGMEKSCFLKHWKEGRFHEMGLINCLPNGVTAAEASHPKRVHLELLSNAPPYMKKKLCTYSPVFPEVCGISFYNFAKRCNISRISTMKKSKK